MIDLDKIKADNAARRYDFAARHIGQDACEDIDALVTAYEKEHAMRLHACEDWAEEDTVIRELCKKVLPNDKVEFVEGEDRAPDLVELTAMLVEKIERLTEAVDHLHIVNYRMKEGR